MAKSPAFQFYAAEYLADERVQLLSLAQEGIYIRLLCYCWREGSIPADDASLRLLAKGCRSCDLASVKALFDEGSEGRLVHGRLEIERDKQARFRERQTQNGGKGGRPKNPEKTHGLSLANPQESSSFASSFASSLKPQTPSIPTIGDQSQAIAIKVCQEAPISGLKEKMAIEIVARHELSSGVDFESTVSALLGAWREYTLNRGKLQITWGAEAFFGQGHWKDKAAWPWKDGKQPAPKKVYLA